MRAADLTITLLAIALFSASPAIAQPSSGARASSNAPGQAAGAVKANEELLGGTPDKADSRGMGSYPKFSLDTIVNYEVAAAVLRDGPDRRPGPSLRIDASFTYDFTDALSVNGLFQFKPRQPLAADEPNGVLFINQGAGRREGGKMKELYVRAGSYRIGKFVQNFGRAYVLLPGPYPADLTEESEEGYEPAEMIGVERIHIFKNENPGWQMLTMSAFMVDRTPLHHSFPYDEGRIRYKDGGIGNTRLPENLMVTYDVLNMPVGRWAQLTWQASAIRWGKTYHTERRERWATLGGDLAIPIRGSVASTLQGRYSQVRLYVEGAQRHNFNSFAGRTRNYLNASAEYLAGPWMFDLTTTQRWTTDRVLPLQKDELYTATVGYNFPTQTILSLSVADERVDGRKGLYAGFRLTRNFTACSRCNTKRFRDY